MPPGLTSYVDFEKRRLTSILLPALGNWTAHLQLQVTGSSGCVPAEIPKLVQSQSMAKVLGGWRQCNDSRHRRAEAGYERSLYRMWPAQLTVWLPKMSAVLIAPHRSWCCSMTPDKILPLTLPCGLGSNPFKLYSFKDGNQLLLSPNQVLKGTGGDNC